MPGSGTAVATVVPNVACQYGRTLKIAGSKVTSSVREKAPVAWADKDGECSSSNVYAVSPVKSRDALPPPLLASNQMLVVPNGTCEFTQGPNVKPPGGITVG